MRKHVLFFVHGMGVFVDAEGKASNKWSENAAAKLKHQYEKYPSLLTDFDDVFEVVPLNYDTVFNGILQRWASEAQKVTNAGIDSAEVATRMVGWLNGGAQLNNNFAWTHAGDVVLYQYFNLVRQRVKVRVAKQIHDALEPNENGAVSRWSIIAHSLGTAVTHDVLHAMNSATPNQAGISILDAMAPKPKVIAMLANVSKTLETDVNVYESVVVPPIACEYYLSANNRFDPFVMEELLIPDRFQPAGRETWDTAIRDRKFIDLEPENIHQINVHSIDNYLINPAVSIPLLRALCGSGSIPRSLEKRAIKEFTNIPVPDQQQVLDELKKRFIDESWFDAIGKLLPILEDADVL